jgi:hypothetical protein
MMNKRMLAGALTVLMLGSGALVASAQSGAGGDSAMTEVVGVAAPMAELRIKGLDDTIAAVRKCEAFYWTPSAVDHDPAWSSSLGLGTLDECIARANAAWNLQA